MLTLVVNYAEVFTLVLIRMSGFFLMTPFLGGRNVPAMVKIGLIFTLTILVTPVVATSELVAQYQGIAFANLFLIVIKELMVGLTLGLIAAFVFAAVQVGGMFIDMQMGLAMANVFDPATGASTPITGQIKYALTMLLFLGLDGHHGLLTAILQSYTFIPAGGFQITGELTQVVLQTFSMMFVLGIKIAMPVVAALFLTDVGLAILSRAVPQMNVFVVGMPLKIGVGLIMIVLAMPAFIYVLRGLFHTMFQQMDTLLRVMGGSL